MQSFGGRLQGNYINKQIISIEKSITRYKAGAFISMFVAGIFLIIFWSIFYYGNKKNYEYLLDVGTISGGLVSSLFSLAGLILVYVAFLGQKQQLLNQQLELLHNKEELILTRKELQNQQKEMRQQNDTLKLQNFENTFFQLLSNYQKNISLFYVIMDKNLFWDFINLYQTYLPTSQRDVPKRELIDLFNRFKKENTSGFIDYTFLNQIKTLIKIIEKSGLEKKDDYFDILKNVLSENEKRSIYLILNFDENLNIEIKELFEKYNIISDYKIEPSYFINNLIVF